jgi:hypothetical protein
MPKPSRAPIAFRSPCRGQTVTYVSGMDHEMVVRRGAQWRPSVDEADNYVSAGAL